MEFSKILAIFILIFYFLTLTISAVIFLTSNIDISFILQYLQPIVLTVIASYYVKSGVENFKKIDNSKYNNHDDYPNI
jgi:hypothetical protein